MLNKNENVDWFESGGNTMPRLLSVSQGSSEWLELRKICVTATKISSIMGVNPYKSCYQVWQEDLGFIDPEKINDAMKIGSEMEPIALEKLNSEMGYKCVPVVAVHDTNDRFMASIDGFDGRAVEIKCGKKAFEQAKKNIVPEYYQMQMQWQMYVLDIPNVLYYCFDGSDSVFFLVHRNQELIEKMIPLAYEYLNFLDTITPPPMSNLDYEDRKNDPQLDYLMSYYEAAVENRKQAEELEKSYKEKILSYCNHKNTIGSNGKITQVVSKGRIKYDEIPELKQIDLEKYRGDDIISFRITTS